MTNGKLFGLVGGEMRIEMAKVGILYDNISRNTGDVAVGISVKKILSEIGVEFDELFPGNFTPSDYDTIIIGGGHIIRPSPDFFYDKFKVPGQHVLNAVGILDSPQDLNYLEDYKYLTVRSSWDKERLSYLKKEVHVVPCTTMLLEDLEDFPLILEGPSLGIHLLPNMFNGDQEAQFIEWVSSLPFTVYFIPITHYNQDCIYLKHLSTKIKNSILLPIMKPLEIFTLIGKLDYFIGCSLHGGIFAYRHNIPFTLFNYNEKMLYFMKDRGLERFTFTNFNEIKASFDLLLKDTPDYSRKISEDQETLKEHVKHLKEILPSGSSCKTKSSDNTSQTNYQIHNLQSKSIKLECQQNEYESHISTLTNQLQEAMRHVMTLEQAKEERDTQLASLGSQLQEAINRAQMLDYEIAEMRKSIVWQTMMKVHCSFVEKALPQGSMQRGLYNLGIKGGRILANEGLGSFCYKLNRYMNKQICEQTDFELWIEKNEPNIYELRRMEKEAKAFAIRPKISIITPVWNTDEKWLNAAIDSIRNQIYDNWELCITDGGSTKPHIKKIIKKYSLKDKRIKVKFLDENKGISGNSNEALRLATGEFVGFLDHDDELSPFALYEVVRSLNLDPEIDFIYSDEDKLDEAGKRCDAFFKPDWSPDLFLSVMYTCHLGIYRKEIVDLIGGFRNGVDGSQDYDFVLRFTEHTNPKRIAHISKILYHWRKIPGSIASDPTAKNLINIQSAKKALHDTLVRREIEGDVFDGKWISSYRIKRKIIGNPRVSIIIPTRDRVDLLKSCIDSIVSKTTYSNYELIVVDNNSIEHETIDYFSTLDNLVVSYPEKFNFSKIINFGVKYAKGDFLLILNNDVQVINPDWIESMLEHAQRSDVGAVGCKLIYPGNTIQHAGVILGLSPDPRNKVAGHVFIQQPNDSSGYFGLANVIRDLSAVTAAAMMIRKDVFEEIGGFDENLAVSYNDVDLCLKIRKKGYLIVYTPYAELYHHESISRGDNLDENEVRYMLEKWGNALKNDPYYNRNLSLKSVNCEVNID